MEIIIVASLFAAVAGLLGWFRYKVDLAKASTVQALSAAEIAEKALSTMKADHTRLLEAHNALVDRQNLQETALTTISTALSLQGIVRTR
jgi:hypothetical protein